VNNIQQNQIKIQENFHISKSLFIPFPIFVPQIKTSSNMNKIKKRKRYFNEEIPLSSSYKPRGQLLNSNRNNQDYRRPFFIGVAGGSASGKTQVCEEIVNRLNNQSVSIISLENFYKPLNEEEKKNIKSYNFDEPEAFDWEMLMRVLEDLSVSKTVRIPIYDFDSFARLEETKEIHGSLSDVILLEGILVLYQEEVLKYFDMKIFVDTDSDIRLARRVVRDMKLRGRMLEDILYQYETFVKPSFDTFILPTKKLSDVVIPRGGDNTVAIDLIEQLLKIKIEERTFVRLKRDKETI